MFRADTLNGPTDFQGLGPHRLRLDAAELRKGPNVKAPAKKKRMTNEPGFAANRRGGFHGGRLDADLCGRKKS